MPCRHQRGEDLQLLFILDLGNRLGVNDQRHNAVAPYSWGKYFRPIGYEAEWASELVCIQRQEEKSFASARDRTPIGQSVVRQYTD
jgi:hypothetical protein